MAEKFLQGRVALITGASRGIGRATALAFAGAGAKLALVGRDRAKLEESLKLVRDKGAEGEVYICDVREEGQVKQLANDVAKRFGKVHVLVNNAGTAIRKNVIDFSMDEWRALTDTNITGVFLMCKYIVPLMRGQGYGRIINLTSIMAHVSSTGRGVYSATKHAVAGLTKALALELVEDKINCVAISPGFIATDLTAPLRADPAKNEALMAQTPMHRWGQPEEIAGLALYLCSEQAAFMTGNDVLIDGGWCAQ
ncbi:MAG TPA: SDR family NAD(P)-dependent oxidoreductase [Burkholderiales bacterium]|nr:SDR family NAD(P)-dependent oxidoreductase [Burkholderiales bacterium]